MPPLSLAKGMSLIPASASKPFATLLLQNEPVNACTFDFYQTLKALLVDHLPRTNPPTRGLVIASDVKKPIFTAGNDLREFFTPLTTPSRFRDYWQAFQGGISALYSTPILTIAAVRGFSGAAGTGIMLACDYRVGTKDAVVGLNEAALGVPVPPIWAAMMADTCHKGKNRAEHLCKYAIMLEGEEAFAEGLLDEMCPSNDKDQLREQAEKRMMELLSKVPDEGRTITKMYMRQRLSKAWEEELKSSEMADNYYGYFNSEVSRTLVAKILKHTPDGKSLQREEKGKL